MADASQYRPRLQRLRAAACIARRLADGHAHGDEDRDTHRDSHPDASAADLDGHCDPDADRHVDAERDSDANRNFHAERDVYANRDVHADVDTHPAAADGHANGHAHAAASDRHADPGASNGDADGDAHADGRTVTDSDADGHPRAPHGDSHPGAPDLDSDADRNARASHGDPDSSTADRHPDGDGDGDPGAPDRDTDAHQRSSADGNSDTDPRPVHRETRGRGRDGDRTDDRRQLHENIRRRFVVATSDDAGSARWNFSVPASGSYYVWCRVLATSATTDSFFATPQGSGTDVYDLAEGSWSPDWQWSILNGRAGTGIPLTLDPRVVTLQAGSNWIEFGGREDASKIDRIIVTNDPDFVPTEGNVTTFADAPPSNQFYDFIETIARNDVTNGCGSGLYCPSNGVTRAQLAVFLLKSKYGSDYVPPAATGTVFSDVPASSFAAAWIEQLAEEGITSGCGGGRYCPNGVVTRAQMAVFILRAIHAPGYVPPPATGMFTDLQLNDPVHAMGRRAGARRNHLRMR